MGETGLNEWLPASGLLYREITSSEFNTVTPENSLKWEVVQPFEGEYDFRGRKRYGRYASLLFKNPQAPVLTDSAAGQTDSGGGVALHLSALLLILAGRRCRIAHNRQSRR